MKSILLSLLLLGAIALTSCRPVPVTVNQSPGDEIVRQQQLKRVTELESQVDDLRHTNDRWQILCASAGVGAVVLLILGTALGAKTRHDALATS